MRREDRPAVGRGHYFRPAPLPEAVCIVDRWVGPRLRTGRSGHVPLLRAPAARWDFYFCANSPQKRNDSRHSARRAGRMTEFEKFQRASRVFLTRLLMVHGEDAPEVLRRMADELEWLEAERAAELASGDGDPPT